MGEISQTKRAPTYLSAVGALGVVYGDIGTSPLYAIRASFAPGHGIGGGPENVLGVLSLIFWALVLQVSFKYIIITLRAESRGEGGILTLLSMAHGALGKNARKLTRRTVVVIGLIGASLLYGDAAITPAISVLSAVEGLELVAPALHSWIVPIALVILGVLFVVQQHGTARMGRAFGPIILVWFTSLGVLGSISLVRSPEVLACFNPWYAVRFFQHEGFAAFVTLSGVLLVITGAEAIYADLGHFGARPIRLGWFGVALPALLLNYFGQGAAILRDSGAIANPFYAIVPGFLIVPMIVLSTAATVIASQAVITGLYSLTYQAVLLDYVPRLRVVHTSAAQRGQIYMPTVNWLLMAATMGLVLAFESSDALAGAYGLAVTGTMVCTTILLIIVARRLWRWRLWALGATFTVLLIADLAFFSSALLKLREGGWISVVMGLAIYVLFTTWRRGRTLLKERLLPLEMPLETFVANVTTGSNAVTRVPGTAIFLSRSPTGTPRTLGHNVKCNKVLHETVVALTMAVEEAPIVPREEYLTVQKVGEGVYRVIARYGFMQSPAIGQIIADCRPSGLTIELFGTTFFVGHEVIVSTPKPGMARWREMLFAFLSRNAGTPTNFFGIPPNQVVEFGLQVEM